MLVVTAPPRSSGLDVLSQSKSACRTTLSLSGVDLVPPLLGGRNEVRDLASCPHYGKLCVPLDFLNACVSFWKLGEVRRRGVWLRSLLGYSGGRAY